MRIVVTVFCVISFNFGTFSISRYPLKFYIICHHMCLLSVALMFFSCSHFVYGISVQQLWVLFVIFFLKSYLKQRRKIHIFPSSLFLTSVQTQREPMRLQKQSLQVSWSYWTNWTTPTTQVRQLKQTQGSDTPLFLHVCTGTSGTVQLSRSTLAHLWSSKNPKRKQKHKLVTEGCVAQAVSQSDKQTVELAFLAV